jgi:hypothetical protein
MNKTVALVGSLVLLTCIIGGVSYLSQRADQIKRERAKALHEAAKADSDEIQREAKTYWERKNRPLTLRNDLLRLKNDQLENEIAQLQGRPANRSKIQADLSIINNDKLAIEMMDPDAHALNPEQVEARIQVHNRNYPDDQTASISDINREMDQFHQEVGAILEETDKKLRKARGR